MEAGTPGKGFCLGLSERRWDVTDWAPQDANSEMEISRQVKYYGVLLGSIPADVN